MNPPPNKRQLEIGSILFAKVSEVKSSVLMLIQANPDYSVLKTILAQLNWLSVQENSGQAMLEEDLESLSLGIIAVRELNDSGVPVMQNLGKELSAISYLTDEYSR